jgi:hypothetical protein
VLVHQLTQLHHLLLDQLVERNLVPALGVRHLCLMSLDGLLMTLLERGHVLGVAPLPVLDFVLVAGDAFERVLQPCLDLALALDHPLLVVGQGLDLFLGRDQLALGGQRLFVEIPVLALELSELVLAVEALALLGVERVA